MKHHPEKWERLFALFIIGFVTLNYPLLTIFDKNSLIFGIPLLYVYLFVVWLLLILVSAWIIERRR